MTESLAQAADLERPEDAGKTAADQSAFWRAEIERASKHEKSWRERSKKVVEQYRADGRAGKADGEAKPEFNILWSNTETLKPALYSATPRPDIRRRYRDEDKVGSAVAQALERAVSFAIDTYDFDETIISAIEDYLLPGRGIVRVRYIPTMAKGEPPRVPVEAEETVDDATGDVLVRAFMLEGEVLGEDVEVLFDEDAQGYYMIGVAEDEVVWEESRCEYVLWENFRQSSEPKWRDKRWIAFGGEMTRDELVAAFGEDKGNAVILMGNSADEGDTDGEAASLKTAFVWEIWDRVEKRVRFVSDGYKQGFLADLDDPLNLINFFPTPEPLISVKTNNSSIPIPEYTLYQDLARELNCITDRISKLVSALRARGIYDAQYKAWMEQLMASDDNALIAADGFQQFAEKGGIDGAITWMPVEQIGKVLVGLYNQRQQVINAIYEITGISDIMRGATDPRETAAAQKLKGQFGSMRIQPRQKQVQRYVRDLFRIKAEIIAELFEPETLAAMTGMEITPEMVAIMRDDAMRAYRVDIETDSTIAADEQKDKQDVAELFGAMGEFVGAIGPLVTEGAIPKDAALAVMKWGMRRFKVSREIEQMLDPPPQQEGQQPTDPKQAAAQAAQQAEMRRVQAELQLKQQQAQQEAKVREQQAQADIARRDFEMRAEQARKDRETEQRMNLARQEFEREQQRTDAETRARVAMQHRQAAARETV